jgi:hypothetical protein
MLVIILHFIGQVQNCMYQLEIIIDCNAMLIEIQKM